MKKGILTVAFSSIAALSLMSCHGTLVPKNASTTTIQDDYDSDSAVFDGPATFDESKEYTITFWAKNDSNANQIAAYNNAITSFEKLYPNITVNMVSYTDYGVIYSDVLKHISTNTTPNVCIAYPDHVATYLTGSDVVVNLDGLINNPSYGLGGSDLKFDGVKKSEIYSKYFEEGAINKRHYILPFMRSSEALYINKTYVEKLGFTVPDVPTWDWIWQVSAEAIKEKTDGTFNPSGNDVLYPLIYKSSDNMFITLLKEHGYEYITEDGGIPFLNDDRVADMLVDLAEKGKAGYWETFKSVSYPANSLNKWECVFAVDSTAGSTWMGYDAVISDAGSQAKGASFETVVRTVPQLDTENLVMPSQGPSICIFNKTDKQEVIASWLFAQYLMTNDVQMQYARTEGYLPVTTKCTSSEAYQRYLSDVNEYSVKIAASKLVLNNVNNTFITPVFNGSSNVRNAAADLIDFVLYPKYRTKEAITTTLYQRVIQNNELQPIIDKYNASH